MKTMLLLGAASSFFVAFTSTASFAQTTPSISSASVALTCRSALQGDQFTQVQNIASPPCCYVSIEEDWYKAKGVELSSIYQRSNGDTYRAESCELLSDAGKPIDLTTTGAIGASGAPLSGQPANLAGAMPAGSQVGQAPKAATASPGDTTSGNTAGNMGGTSGGQNGGGNAGGNGSGYNGGDGNNGHGNDAGGSDPSNPGKSGGTANNGNNGSGSGPKGNNGFGNGGGDGSPNGKQDETR
jgi:hypothetical protein